MLQHIGVFSNSLCRENSWNYLTYSSFSSDSYFLAWCSAKCLVLCQHKGNTEDPALPPKLSLAGAEPALTQCPTCGFCLPARFPHGTTGSLEAKGRYDRDPENTKLFTQLTDAWQQPEAAFWSRVASGIGQMSIFKHQCLLEWSKASP